MCKTNDNHNGKPLCIDSTMAHHWMIDELSGESYCKRCGKQYKHATKNDIENWLIAKTRRANTPFIISQ